MSFVADSFLQEANTVETCNDAACYFPLDKGRYEVKPGLLPFGTSFGNGKADEQVFQIDSNFPYYRQMKLVARGESLNKYYQTYNYSPAVGSAITRLIIARLSLEYPQLFHYEILGKHKGVFHSNITGETLYLDANWQLQELQTRQNPVFPAYASIFDALASQVQEDLVVVCRDVNSNNWVSAIHLCYPNHWAAESKIGQDFATVHAPVAGIEKINQRAKAMVHTMIAGKPMVRFAWGLSTDTRLNHHPEPPPHIPVTQWYGRQFNLQHPRLYLRIERQVIWGLPEYDAALFTIRTYFRDCAAIKEDDKMRKQLYAALESMSPESLVYKGLADSRDSILAWLNDVG
jgi:hypothetical protein